MNDILFKVSEHCDNFDDYISLSLVNKFLYNYFRSKKFQRKEKFIPYFTSLDKEFMREKTRLYNIYYIMDHPYVFWDRDEMKKKLTPFVLNLFDVIF